MKNKKNLIKQLVNSCVGINFSTLNLTKEGIEEFLKDETHQIALRQLLAHKKLTKRPNMISNCIYEIRYVLDICFMAYYTEENKELYLLGPFLTKPANPQDLQIELYGLVSKTLSTLPIISINKAYEIISIIVEDIKEDGKALYKIMDLRETQDNNSGAPISKSNEEIVQMKQIENRYEKSAALTEAVKEGNFSLAIKFLTELNKGSVVTVRNSNPLRNRQNYCIILNTQLRYALESCGIHPYRLDRFSEGVAIKIEKLKTLEEVDRFVFDTIRQYCELAVEHIYPNLKPLVHLTVAYIKNYLTDNINVKTTAKELGVNANYLSTIFHNEMGMTFIDFLNKERVKQAAALMTNTDLQIQEIATSVGYNNGSYFAKQFKKYYNMSPAEYKKHLRI